MYQNMVEGDVLSYRPAEHWCRQGQAVVVQVRGGNLIAIDTYWGINPCMEAHILTAEELKGAELEFNMTDFEALDFHSPASKAVWDTYHPDDARVIGSQHAHQKHYFIRKGATPDLGTQIANAENVVAERKDDVRSAQAALRWAEEYLEELKAKAL